MFRTVTINGVELDVTYDYEPIVHATFNDPAEGGDLEIERIELDGKSVDSILAAHVVEEIKRKLEKTSEADYLRQRDAEYADAKIAAAVEYLEFHS